MYTWLIGQAQAPLLDSCELFLATLLVLGALDLKLLGYW
jgi:hypothetical protein